MDKYYTPEIEEFHIGFEYEYEDINESGSTTSWYKTVIKENECYIIDQHLKYSDDLNLRVKYLDKEDIESLGFISSNVIDVLKEEDEFIKGFEKNTYILYIQEDKKLVIYNQKEYDISNKITGNWTEEILFKGLIKNKSELIKLLKQLGIE